MKKGTTVKLNNVRLSFPKLHKPEAFGGGEPKYSASFLLDPESDTGKQNIKLFKQALDEACKAKWGDDKGKWPKFKQDHKCFRDGNDFEYDGYADMKVISSSERKPPMLLNRDKTPLNEAECMQRDVLEAGDYVNAVINIWCYDTKTEEGMPVKGYGANLRAVQFIEVGERFGGGEPIDGDEWFDDIDDGGEEDEL